MVQYFTRNDIIRLLRLLAADLDTRGIEADISLIGGAALAIRYFERALTADIDAALFPESAILELSEEFAVKQGFPLTGSTRMQKFSSLDTVIRQSGSKSSAMAE